jgi:chemotaxis signal transduction protein
MPSVDSTSPSSPSSPPAEPPSAPEERAPTSSAEASAGPSSSRREGPLYRSRRDSRHQEGIHACVFWLGGQRYALDTVDVLEAITLLQMVPVPLSPPWLLGLTSLRGTPLPIVDLPLVLGLPADAEASFANVGGAGLPALVLRVEGALLGGRVDRIEAVYAFEGARLEAAASSAEHPAVRGLLDVGRVAIPATLLDHDELARRVNELRFRPRWEQGFEGERRHVAKA